MLGTGYSMLSQSLCPFRSYNLVKESNIKEINKISGKYYRECKQITVISNTDHLFWTEWQGKNELQAKNPCQFTMGMVKATSGLFETN